MICFVKVYQAIKEINEAIRDNNEEVLTSLLCNSAAKLSGVTTENRSWYMKMLEEKRTIKEQVLFIMGACLLGLIIIKESYF